MSTDREEIRWKFQVILENLETVKDELEIERKLIDQRYVRTIQEVERMRNYWFAGIGFFMMFFTSIIIARGLEDIYFVYPIGAGIIGFTIFVITNIRLASAHATFREIDDVYYGIVKGSLIRLKGMVSTYAFMENLSKDDVDTLIVYVALIGKAISYNMVQYMDKKLNLRQFKVEDFRIHYELAKSMINKFKEKNYPLGIELLEEFIRDFEKRDSRKKPKN